jgi:hypothetical protein
VHVVVDERGGEGVDQVVRHPGEARGERGEGHAQQLKASRHAAVTASGSASA